MRLEFQLEDRIQEINWWKNLVHPNRVPQSQEFRPVHSRVSLGRARIQAERASIKKDK